MALIGFWAGKLITSSLVIIDVLNKKPLDEKSVRLTSEWSLLLETLIKELPIGFRITAQQSYQKIFIKETIQRFQSKFPHLLRPLPWYPTGTAYECSLSRPMLKTVPELKVFHDFLVHESETGMITRQELVSMIPALFLCNGLANVTGTRHVLDMCAAPGSKTSQLIEFFDSRKDVVIANDVDSRRAHMLIHRLKKMDTSHVIVTSHAAQFFPTLFKDSEPLAYDGILCDVPCSGDGTLRKSKYLWQEWHPNRAFGLHRLQLQILHRTTGAMPYVWRMLTTFYRCSNDGRDCRLVSSNVYHGLSAISRLGKIWHKSKWFDSFDECSRQCHCSKCPVRQSMFRTPSNADILKRCLRFYPHVNDTGGFFIAVFTKRHHNVSEMKGGPKVHNSEENCAQQTRRKSQTNSEIQSLKEPMQDVEVTALQSFGSASENTSETQKESHQPGSDLTSEFHSVPLQHVQTAVLKENQTSNNNEQPQPNKLSQQVDFISLSQQSVMDPAFFWAHAAIPFGFTESWTQFDNFLIRREATSTFPKHIWVCTLAAKEYIDRWSKSPLSILYVGCIAFEHTHKDSKYRLTQVGLKCLVNRLRVPWVPASRRIAILPSKEALLPLLLAPPDNGEEAEKTKLLFRHKVANITDDITKKAIELLEENSPCMIQVNLQDETISVSTSSNLRLFVLVQIFLSILRIFAIL